MAENSADGAPVRGSELDGKTNREVGGYIGRLLVGVGVGIGRLGLGLEASESMSTAIGVVVLRGGGLEVKMGSKMPSEGISGAGELAMRANFEH